MRTARFQMFLISGVCALLSLSSAAAQSPGGKGVPATPSHYELAIDTIAVVGAKADGRNWDAFGGYPDLQVIVRNLTAGTAYSSSTASDTLDHEFGVLAGRVNVGQTLEIDVWDRDLCYDDHVGLKRLDLTRELLHAGGVELSFGQVTRLKLKFFAVRRVESAMPALPAAPWDESAARFAQIWPSQEGVHVATRSKGQERAIVLVHGLRAQWWCDARVHRPYFDSWQEPHSRLVKALRGRGDVYGFSYAQNIALDDVAAAPALAGGVERLKSLGYSEIVVVGHSAGGVVARQFVEDHPKSGVTRVVQVCAPNAGACLAHCDFAVRPSQRVFVRSLTPQARMVAAARRNGRIPDDVGFVCVVGTFGRFGDCALSCHSQWPDDLQRQGIPALALPVDHHFCMETQSAVDAIAELVALPLPRWRSGETAQMQRTFFE